MRYQVEAIRSGKWWALEFPDHQGVHSQVKRLDQAPEMAAEALSFSLDTTIVAGQIEVDITLPPLLDSAVRDAAQSRLAAASSAEAAKQSMVLAVTRCADNGLSARDMGELLGVSHQYASKILQRNN